MARSYAKTLRTTAVVTVASAAAVAGLIGVAGAVGSSPSASTSATGYGYGYGYGYGPSASPSASASPSSTASSSPSSSSSPSTSPSTPANPALGLKITLKISKEFVTVGTRITLSGTATRNGVPAAGVPVLLTKRYSDGRTGPLGVFTTDAFGNFSHIDIPLYISNITATAYGVSSNTVPSRVILTYRQVRTGRSGDVVTVVAQTRPGFVTGRNRAERVQLLLTDSHGRQLKVLQVANAAQRSAAPGELHGVNQVTFKPTNLGHGTHYLVVKVIGTPVNTGASTKPLKFVTP